MSSESPHDDADADPSNDEMNGSEYQLPTLTRRQAMAGGSAAAIAVGAGMLQSDLVRAVAAQSTEPRIQLGNDWEIDDDSGDLVLNHIPTGDEIRYDESAGEWRSSVGFSIEGDWLLDSQELAGTQRLVLTGVGANAEAELFLQATGTADRARMILTPDSSLSNYAGIKLDAQGANLLETVAAGTATPEPLVIGVDGTSHLTLETGGDIDANQQHIKNAGAVTTDKIVIGGTLYEEDANSPLDVSNTSSTTYTVSGTYDDLIILPYGDGQGFNQLQVNGDTGTNYDYADTADASTTGQSEWLTQYAYLSTIYRLWDGLGGRIEHRAVVGGAVTSADYRGENKNVSGPITQFTFKDSGGANRNLKARVYGRDLS